MILNIKRACKEIHKNSIDHGFWEVENISEKLLLIVSEIAEACEASRKTDIKHDNVFKYLTETAKTDSDFELYIKDTFGDELADAVIRIFDLAEHLNIPLEFHVKAKHEYNKNRPYKHNKKF